MRRKKLGIYGITLVILAGLFQLITLSLDQVVIQLEEDNRIISDKISKKNKEKEFALENNRRIGEIIRSSHFQSLIISSFDFENQYLEYGNYMKTYFSRNSMKSNKNVLRDVLADEQTLQTLCDKKFKDIIPKNEIEYVPDHVLKTNVCDQFTYILKTLSSRIEYFDNYNKIENWDVIQQDLGYVEYYLDILLKYFGMVGDQLFESLYVLNNDQYVINQNKQLYLLFSMVSQLISFLFLLLLFRRILK